MDTSLPRGIRDIEPEEYLRHARVRAAFEEVSQLYNFRMMEPASIEHLGTLRMKSGTDVDDEIYAFKDKGGRDLGLRFDLTVGITRFVCARKGLKLPAKIAAFGGMWRYDEPQYGRYRWAHQWDLEIFGPPSVESDAEVIDASSAIIKRIGLETSVIKIGDRRVVESFIRERVGDSDKVKTVELMRALDKVEKKTRHELVHEYEAKGFTAKEVNDVLDLGNLNGAPEEVLQKAKEMKLSQTQDLETLSDLLKARSVRNVQFNLRIVRGIDYYTGIVFEIGDSANPKLGSLCGGGRYDALPRAFGRPDLSATGAAGGVERESMSMAGSPGPIRRMAFVAYATTDVFGAASEILTRVREAGVPCDMSLLGKSLAKQMEDASSMGAGWVLIVGRKEVATGTVTIREMQSRREESVPLAEAIGRLTRG